MCFKDIRRFGGCLLLLCAKCVMVCVLQYATAAEIKGLNKFYLLIFE